jgi:hypothetical protein
MIGSLGKCSARCKEIIACAEISAATQMVSSSRQCNVGCGLEHTGNGRLVGFGNSILFLQGILDGLRSNKTSLAPFYFMPRMLKEALHSQSACLQNGVDGELGLRKKPLEW